MTDLLDGQATRWVALFVDDEPDILDTVRQLLEAGIPGLRVVTASSGKSGLKALAGQRIDLIVSDFRMPGMDGLEFLDQCGRKHPRVPRAILTAFPSHELQSTVNDAGASFLSKRMDPTALVDWVRHHLESSPFRAGTASVKGPSALDLHAK